MALQDLILRSESHPPLTTKGSELTYAELDGNFIELYDYLSGMNSASAIAPYDNGATYTGTEYVSFDGNIYVHISPTSTTGVFPDTNPAIWELTSIGALAHQKDRDSFLAFGTAEEIGAVDIHNIVNYQIINITYSDFNTEIADAKLKVNRLYCITNTSAVLDTGIYANSQIKLYIRTTSTTQYSRKGFISFVAPKYDTFGSYDYNTSYSVGDKVGYGLFVYECTDATTNGDSPNIATGEWTIKSYLSFPAFYTIRYFDVDFFSGFGGLNVTKVYDDNNNTFGASDFNNGNIASTEIIRNNDIDSSSFWNNIAGFTGGATLNKLVNSSFVVSKGGSNVTQIDNNYLNKSAIICDEFINGSIDNNHLRNVQINILGGNFEGILSNTKIEFAEVTEINIDELTEASGYMNEQGSDISIEIDINSTGGDIDLETLSGGRADIYGEFRMICTGQNVEYLRKDNYYCPIVIKPITADESIVVKIIAVGSANTDNLVSGNYSGDIELFTNNGDYAILERVVARGFVLWNVKYINKLV